MVFMLNQLIFNWIAVLYFSLPKMSIMWKIKKNGENDESKENNTLTMSYLNKLSMTPASARDYFKSLYRARDSSIALNGQPVPHSR